MLRGRAGAGGPGAPSLGGLSPSGEVILHQVVPFLSDG